MDPLDVLSRTGDPAFGTDEGGRIVIWNKPAEELLGYKAEEVLGKSCCEALYGHSIFGNRFCDENCTIMSMVRRREPVHRFEIDLRNAEGTFVRVSISVVVVPGSRASQFTIIHLLQPGSMVQPSISSPSPTLPGMQHAPPADDQPLSSRELEVLKLVADGFGNQRVADSLFISVATVRNHVQNILKKLDVHSKAEAVALGLRNRLI